MNTTTVPTSETRELVITRLINAPASKLYRAWTEPELMKEWFCPRPWTTPAIENDVRTGGSSYVLMQGPNGERHENRGIYLEIIPNKKLVFTDAYTKAWEPSNKSFMTGIITFEEEGGKTRYTARVLHWSTEDRQTHEKMGFRDGWSKATDQLEALVARI